MSGPDSVLWIDESGEAAWLPPSPDETWYEERTPYGAAGFSPDFDSAPLGGAAIDTAGNPPRLAGMGGPPGGSRAPFDLRLAWQPSVDLKNQPGTWGTNRERLGLAAPIRIDPDGIWLGIGSLQRLEIASSAILPDSGMPAPNELWDVEFGVMHFRELGDGWRAGGMVRIGSPSDRPFSEWRDMTVTLLAFLTVPANERDAWSFSLFYSPTGQIIYPIPGIAYVWRPSPQFEANLGIPFSLAYRPTERFSITASYMPLTDIRVIARQRLGECWSVFGGYETVNETYLLADRVDTRQRTYLFDQRLVLGLQRQLGNGWSLDFSTAYVFDRKFFQAQKFAGTRTDELGIEPGLAGMVQLQWTR